MDSEKTGGITSGDTRSSVSLGNEVIDTGEQGGLSSSGEERPSQLVFHYNRERRLAKASEAVRRTYTEGYTPNKGFIKGLTANAGLRSVLAVIVILCAVVIILSVFGPSESEGSFHGVPVRLRAFVFDETLFVAVTFDGTSVLPGEFPAMVKAEITASDSGGTPAARSEVTGRYTGTELVLRYSGTDYDFAGVKVSVSFLNPRKGDSVENLVLSTRVKRE